VEMTSKFPEIETERLALKHITQYDSQGIFQLYSQAENIKFSDNDILSTEKEAKELICNLQKEFEKKNSIHWKISLKNCTEIIGVVSLYHIDWKHKFASTSSILKPSYRRKGIISEAQSAIFCYAFKALDLNRIEVQLFVENHASIAKNEKLGFVKEGRLRQNFMINNKLEDSYIYSLLKEDFL